MASLALLYNNFIRYFLKEGYEVTCREIAEALPILSQKGITRDDMSLAGWIVLDQIDAAFEQLMQQQRSFYEKEKKRLEDGLKPKQKELTDRGHKLKQTAIEQARLDEQIQTENEGLASLDKKAEGLAHKIKRLSKELKQLKTKYDAIDDKRNTLKTKLTAKQDQQTDLVKTVEIEYAIIKRLKTGIEQLKTRIETEAEKIQQLAGKEVDKLGKAVEKKVDEVVNDGSGSSVMDKVRKVSKTLVNFLEKNKS